MAREQKEVRDIHLGKISLSARGREGCGTFGGTADSAVLAYGETRGVMRDADGWGTDQTIREVSIIVPQDRGEHASLTL